MSLGLAAPFALVLGGLLALPIAAHLARQTPRDRQPFGAMLLLERMVKRLRRRRRIKDLPLLLLRLLAVALVVLVATGPVFRYPGTLPEFGGTGRVVLVVDHSMSMSLQDGGKTLLERARQDALDVLAGLPPGVLVGLVSYGEEAERATPSLTSDHARVRAYLEAISASHGRSDLRGGLLEARRLLGGEVGEVLVFTDEAGPRQVGEARNEIQLLVEGGSSVIPRISQADPVRNAAVVAANYTDGPNGGEVVIRVASYGAVEREVSCEVSLPGGAVVPVFVELPPEGQAEERITVPEEVPGGVGKAWCNDPDLPSDDARYFHVPRVGASRVLVVDGDPGHTPTRSEVYFLERALAPWGAARTGVALDVVPAVGLTQLDPDEHRVVFLANLGDPRPFALPLADFVRRGGSLVITAGDNVTADRYNAAFGALLPAPVRGARGVADPGEPGVHVALPAADAALWAPFSRAGRGGFARIASHTVLTLDPYEDVPDEIITWLRYDNRMPALVERRTGAGRVLLWTGTVDLAWGNLPLQAVFMPMVQRLVGWLGAESGAGGQRIDARVGEVVGLELPDLATDPDVIGPDGTPVSRRIEGSQLRFRPLVPGAYQVVLAGSEPLAWVAVNVDPEESDVRPGDSIVEVERELAPELLLREVDLGRGSLIAALVLFLVQALVALRGAAP